MRVAAAASVLLCVSTMVSCVTFQQMCSRRCQAAGEEERLPLFRCSCSPSCATYGDCCYDSEHRDHTTWSKSEFVCLSVANRGEYSAVSGCPAEQPSDFCKEGMGHLPPVTSRRSNATYANIFCAECNKDAGELTTWNVELRCADDDAVGAQDSTRIVYRRGRLWRWSESGRSRSPCRYHVHYGRFALLDSLELRGCGRRTPRCSPSWKDPATAELCRSYADPVYIGERSFRNAHCAQCNYVRTRVVHCLPPSIREMLQAGHPHDPSVTRFCSTRGSEACVQSLSGKGRPYPFALLLNVLEVGCTPDPGQRRCCDGERYDFRSKRCRRVTRR